jgi:hypothetical protein
MKLTGLLVVLILGSLLAGCSGGGEDSGTALSSQDSKSIQVTTPDATAADNAKALAAADMDPEVKKVLGGAGK